MKNGKINGLLDVYGVIYLVRNKVNGKCYIGQTYQKNGFRDRYGVKYNQSLVEGFYNSHKQMVIKAKESKRQLIYERDLILQDLEKYGIENFEVNECIDYAFSQDELNTKEKMYIMLYKSVVKNNYIDDNNIVNIANPIVTNNNVSNGIFFIKNNDNSIGGYNKTYGGNYCKWTEVAKQNVRENSIKFWNSGNNREEASKRSKKMWESEEFRKKQSEIQKEAQNRPEVKDKRSKISKKNWKNPTYRHSVIETQKKTWDNENKRKEHSKKQKERWNDPELRKKQSEIQKEVQNRPEVKEKQSKIQKEVQNKPEVKEKQRKAQGGANNARSRMVVSLASIEKNYDRKIFSYIKEAAQWVSEKIGHSYSNGEISACCKGERDFFGEMPDGSKLSWRFLEDFSNEELNNMLNSVEFLNKEKEMIEKQLERNKNLPNINKKINIKKDITKNVTKNIGNCYAPKPVICISGIINKYDRKVFPNLGEAESWMKKNKLKGINRRRISLCCKGRINYQGHGFNGEKLKWRFLYDLSNEELNNLLVSIELTKEEKEIVQKQISKN